MKYFTKDELEDITKELLETYVTDKTKMILAFLQSLQLIFQSVSILDSWFQRYLKAKYISICKIIAFLQYEMALSN